MRQATREPESLLQRDAEPPGERARNDPGSEYRDDAYQFANCAVAVAAPKSDRERRHHQDVSPGHRSATQRRVVRLREMLHDLIDRGVGLFIRDGRVVSS